MTTKEYLLNRLREKIARVYNSLPTTDFSSPIDAGDVHTVAVILGSSRSGSSFLFSSLCESEAFWSPQGEETPFYRRAEWGWVENVNQSDAFPAPWGLPALREASAALLADVGRVSSSGFNTNIFTAQSAIRLLTQWPTLDLQPEDVISSFNLIQEKESPALWNNWLSAMGIDRHLYALNGFAGLTSQNFEFPEFLIEEPPFIVQRSRETPSKSDLQNGVLLLKTSGNAYRIPFLRALFPRAKFKWIVLSRHPAASINGLIDGWTSGAFHSHHVREFCPLKIKGYSDIYPNGESWWKFDMPPGWSDMKGENLAAVCAFQWMSAYENICAFAEATSDPVLRVKYEDLAHPERSAKAFDEIYSFAGVTPRSLQPIAYPVMASHPPLEGRWRRREAEIRPHLERAAVIALAAKLNYDLKV